MKILLDTHLLLWTVARSNMLSAEARSLIDDPLNQPFFSVASVWKTAIKFSRGRLEFNLPPHELREILLASGYDELNILGTHATAVAGLPHIHKDPFDRLLIAQSMVEGITLLTADRTIARYQGPIRRV
ncbi:MAG: type II toxin-antitoxin system VapC family toxin [Terracidiphilus sp.]